MEQIMSFIFGMLTITGIAAVATIVVGTLKIDKQNYRIRNVESTIEQIWSTMYTKEINVYKKMDELQSEIYRKINSMEEVLSRQLDRVEHCIDTSLTKKEILKG